MSTRSHSCAPATDSLPELIAFVARCGGELGLARETALKLELIAEELFTNAVRHGGGTAPVQLELCREGALVRLCFEDGGPEHDPFAHMNHELHRREVAERPVGGLGVVLIDGLARRVRYERAGGRNRVEAWLDCAG